MKMTPEMEQEIATAIDELPGGIWEVWTANDFRRITAQGGCDGGVLRGVITRDREGSLSMQEERLQALCKVINLTRQALQ